MRQPACIHSLHEQPQKWRQSAVMTERWLNATLPDMQGWITWLPGSWSASAALTLRAAVRVGGTVTRNSFRHSGYSGVHSADSWVDVKGNDYVLADNRGTTTKRS